MQLVDDRRWQHRVLEALACEATSCETPVPVRAFDGESIIAGEGGAVWELLSYVGGDAIGWSGVPGMREVGALLASFHDAATRVEVPSQRPAAVSIAAVPAILGGDLGRELDAALSFVGHRERAVGVVHGDFTNHNVIARGVPARAVGAIDFSLAHVEAPLADLGYALWRSGRPEQHATWIDAGRAVDFVVGYHARRPLSVGEVAAVPTYIFGRGLQIMAKRALVGASAPHAYEQVAWLRLNRSRLADRLVDAVTQH